MTKTPFAFNNWFRPSRKIHSLDENHIFPDAILQFSGINSISDDSEDGKGRGGKGGEKC